MKRRSFVSLIIAGTAACALGLKKALEFKTVLRLDKVSMLEYNKQSDLPVGSEKAPLTQEAIPVTVKSIRMQDLKKGDWFYLSINKNFSLFEGPFEAKGNPFPEKPEGNWGIKIN